MNIIHVLNTNSYSGAENVCITILKQFNKDEDYHTTYVSLKGPIQKIIEDDGLNFYGLNKMNIKNLKKMIKELKPDILHCHDFTASILTTFATHSIPIISHIHSNPLWIKKMNSKTLLYTLTLRRYSYVLGVSRSIFDEFIFTKWINDYKIVSNPIFLADINSLVKEKKYDVIFLGRLTEPKDPIRFIELIKILCDKFPDIKVAMLGDGDLRTACEQKISIDGLEKNINVMGFKKNRYDYICLSKLMCITSKWEGFGLMAIESLALGVPVVTTGVGGLKDIVTDECGKICKDNDEFIQEITSLLKDDIKYNLKKEKALQRAKELENIEVYMENLKDIYAKCLYRSEK